MQSTGNNLSPDVYPSSPVRCLLLRSQPRNARDFCNTVSSLVQLRIKNSKPDNSTFSSPQKARPQKVTALELFLWNISDLSVAGTVRQGWVLPPLVMLHRLFLWESAGLSVDHSGVYSETGNSNLSGGPKVLAETEHEASQAAWGCLELLQQCLVNKMNCKLPLCVTGHESRKKNFNKNRIASLLQKNTLYLWRAISAPRAGRGE